MGGVPTNVVYEKGVGTFNGTTSFIDYSNSTGITNGLTACTWRIKFNKPTLAINNCLLAKWDYNTQGQWGIQTDGGSSDELLIIIANAIGDAGNLYYTTSNANLTINTDYELVIVYDGTLVAANRIKAYLNGTLLTGSATGTIPTSLTSARSTIKTGKFGGSLTRFLGGDQDFIEIYNYALTAEEVKNLYEGKRFRALGPGHKEQLGPELVVDGGFDVDGGGGVWLATMGWNITGGKAVSPVMIGDLYQSAVLTIGKTYTVTYTISDYLAGTIKAQCGTGMGTVRTANGTYTEQITCASNTNFLLEGITSYPGKVDNVSCKEVIVSEILEILSVSAQSGSIRNKWDTVIRQPLSISETCEFWFDGKDADSFTLDGNYVNQWNDKSGNARHVLNGNGDATRPTYNAATGRVTFVAANSTFLQSAVFGSELTQPNTIFVVAKFTAHATNSILFCGAVANKRHQFHESTTNFAIYSGAVLNGTARNLNDNIHIGLFNGASSEYWINGTSVVSGNAGTFALNGITLAANEVLSQNSSSELMEVIGYHADLTDADRLGINNYLAAKWGISATTALPLTNTAVSVFKDAEIPYAMFFDGATSLLETTLADNINSISFWMKPKTDTESIMDLGGGGNTISTVGGTLTAAWADDIYVGGEIATAVNTNVWNHITCTADSAITLVSPAIGHIHPTHFKGLLDAIKFIEGTLTGNEASQLFSSEKWKYNI